jgi:hypothetical protein
MRRLIAAAAGMILAFGSIGCQIGQTSTPFKIGAAAAGPFVQRLTDEYIRADSALSADEKAARYTATAALKAATANRESITVDAVEAAWNTVRPWFFAYTDADRNLDNRRTLSPPALSDRQIIQDVAKRLDNLIELERKRVAKWIHPAVISPAPSPATSTP